MDSYVLKNYIVDLSVIKSLQKEYSSSSVLDFKANIDDRIELMLDLLFGIAEARDFSPSECLAFNTLKELNILKEIKIKN